MLKKAVTLIVNWISCLVYASIFMDIAMGQSHLHSHLGKLIGLSVPLVLFVVFRFIKPNSSWFRLILLSIVTYFAIPFMAGFLMAIFILENAHMMSIASGFFYGAMAAVFYAPWNFPLFFFNLFLFRWISRPDSKTKLERAA